MSKRSKVEADRALRHAIGPYLEAAGFEGRYPHYYRLLADGEGWMLSVQHDKYGGTYGVELGWMPPRKVLPVLDPPRPKSVSRLRSWSVDPDLRMDPPGGYLRYDLDLARAVRRIAAAVEKAVPAWFLQNARIAARLGPRTSAATLARLENEVSWVWRWVDQNARLPACRTRLQKKLAAAKDNERKAWWAWKLAKAGDRAAYALLVELLDDPPIETRYSWEPGASFRAAQALADVHGWPYRWGTVAAIKRRVAALRPAPRGRGR